MEKTIFATTGKVTTERRIIKGPPAPERVTIYARDGSSMSVYPIDAREIVAGGEYSYEPPTADSQPIVTGVSGETDKTEAPRRGRPPKAQTESAEG